MPRGFFTFPIFLAAVRLYNVCAARRASGARAVRFAGCGLGRVCPRRRRATRVISRNRAKYENLTRQETDDTEIKSKKWVSRKTHRVGVV